jgi:hypothetical protein
MTHVSFLELDRLASGEPCQEETRHHAQSCAQCGDYIARLRLPASAELPRWALALRDNGEPLRDNGEPPRAIIPTPRQRSFWLPALLAAALSLGGTLLLLNSGPTESLAPALPPLPARTPYVAAKGGPSVAVYLKRGELVFLWDGHSKVLPGDRIRLRIQAAEFRSVVVTSPSLNGPVTLYQGPLHGDTELPVAWEVDGQGDAERLHVMLTAPASANPSGDEQSASEQNTIPQTSATWIQEYVLPKDLGQ